jgi:hypothetical protein
MHSKANSTTNVPLAFRLRATQGEVLKWAVGQGYCEACKRGHFRVVEMLCSHGLNPDKLGLTEAMHQALETSECEVGGHVQIVRFLIVSRCVGGRVERACDGSFAFEHFQFPLSLSKCNCGWLALGCLA